MLLILLLLFLKGIQILIPFIYLLFKNILVHGTLFKTVYRSFGGA